MNPDNYDYDDDEQTSITDTQPISRDLAIAHQEMKELDEECQQTTIRLQDLGLIPATADGAGV